MAAVYTDPLITEIIARNDNFKKGMREARAVYATEAQTIERRSTALATNLERDLARSGMASRNLGRQIADVGSQLAGGQNPLLILSQQAPQVADALAGTTGAAGRMATFFAGPWGAAILAAGSVLGVLAGKLFEAEGAGEAAERGFDKAKGGVDRLKAAIDRLNQQNLTPAEQATSDINEVLARRNKLLADRAALEARIASAQGSRAAVQRRRGLQAELGPIDAELASLNSALGNGGIRLEQIRIEEAERARRTSARSGRALGSIEKEQRALEASLRTITTALDPAQAAAAAFRDTIAEIDRLEGKGLIRSAQAATFRFEAGRQQAEAVAKAASERMAAMDKESGFNPDAIIRRASERLDAEREVNQQLAQEQQDNVRSLALLYEDLLLGGTRNIWDTFKRLGIRVIAETLANFSANGGKGGIGGAIVAGIGAVFGRASGGYVGPRQTVRVNEQAGGAEFLRMGSQGGTVIPLGQVNQAANRPMMGGGVATVRLELSGDLDARIQSVSGGVALEVVRSAAPTIIDASARETTARLTRPRL